MLPVNEKPVAFRDEHTSGVDVEVNRDGDSTTDGSSSIDASELPFLVTHWLQNYAQSHASIDPGNDRNSSRQNALSRIHRATAELAAAFSSLGAYGRSTNPALALASRDDDHSNAATLVARSRNATFSDLRRRWSTIPSGHLENLVGAAVSSSSAVDQVAAQSTESNLVLAANEAINQQRRNPSTGRTLQDVIVLDDDDEATNNAAVDTPVPIRTSILQPPALVRFDLKEEHDPDNPESAANYNNESMDAVKVPTHLDDSKRPALQSECRILETKAAETMRRFLDLRDMQQAQLDELRTLKRSLEINRQTKEVLEAENTSPDAATTRHAMDEMREMEQNAERVIAQLERKIGDVEKSHEQVTQEMNTTRDQAYRLFRKAQASNHNFRDPLRLSGPHSNRTLQTMVNRQYGFPNRPMATSRTFTASTNAASGIQKSLLTRRLAHVTTISAHLHESVFCLRFDRTGRYFVTGADDCMVKVFYLGGGSFSSTASDNLPSWGSGNGDHLMARGYGEHSRGAVLVNTLRGHVGVICDIDVSSDNCFLATASGDGDVRIWGLHDGCPVAILRGHAGGANMVSWSHLTPYKLVTAGQDGFARTWDIREAALKRYGKMVKSRPEYLLRLTDEEKEQSRIQRRGSQPPAGTGVSVPPLPPRQNQEDDGTYNGGPEEPLNDGPPELPPLPPPPGDLPPPPPLPPAPDEVPAPAEPPNNNNMLSGLFVANDDIDEGVRLVEKFQHGASAEERLAVQGPGTRSRRAAVEVLCVARSPTGGHFATGASDGICRVWMEDPSDDIDVQMVDRRCSERKVRRTGLRSSSNKLLLTLKGHLNSITDLQYSHVGDRLMTASLKDGVVRIWSWDVDPASASMQDSNSQNSDRGLRNIVIKLVNPTASNSNSSRKGRRRGPANQTTAQDSKVSCDAAVWSYDDSKIITSQSEEIKADKIHPGSQCFFLWDSHTGHCLMGLAGAHTKTCSLVIPHPSDAAVFCSAGKDGLVKVWDWKSGKCLFAHENTVVHGAVAPHDRGKQSGFLDGSFFQDGTGIVLTDDSGRVSVFDAVVPPFQKQVTCPLWMKEQYFANDYYDLFYDNNGYCVERGSGQPPHLAPKGARCEHQGAAFPDIVFEVFRKLVGPLPLPTESARLNREVIRFRAEQMGHGNNWARASYQQTRRGNIMREFDPSHTILINSSGAVVCSTEKPASSFSSTPQIGAITASVVVDGDIVTSPRGAPEPRRSNSGRVLSSNYRWRDYSDMLREEDEYQYREADSDDEDFQLPERSARRSASLVDSDEDDDELNEAIRESLSPERRNSRGSRGGTQRRRQHRALASPTAVQQPTRVSSRRRTAPERSSQYDEQDSDEEEQLVSTNNDETGPHKEDYQTHFFKLPLPLEEGHPNNVERQWLRQLESTSFLEGRKFYSPQVGEDVVYIPRVHAELINSFPTLNAPWHKWPQGAAWPVVCCCVRDIRYRFPFKDYWKSSGTSCKSVVAILTLEIIGIPVLSANRRFSWPDAAFVPPTTSYLFELPVFKHGSEEYLLPERLFSHRLKCLEEAIQRSNNLAEGIDVSAYFDESGSSEYISYRGKLIEHGLPDDEQHDDHLANSGYGTLRVQWDTDYNVMSPWEVDVEISRSDYPVLMRNCLNDQDSAVVRNALKKLKRDGDFQELFLDPVDCVRYADYLLRIEVPMHLGFVEKRLDASYYTSRLSVVADIRLMRDNCLKYNGEVGFVSDAARRMYDEFKHEVLGEQEIKSLENLQTRMEGATSGTSPVGRRASRQARRSSLENLPPPGSMAAASAGRRSLRIQIDASHVGAGSRDAAGDTRSARAVARHQRNTSTNDRDEPSRQRGNSRGRAGRQIQRDEVEDDTPNLRRSSRTRNLPRGGNEESQHSQGDGEGVQDTMAAAARQQNCRSSGLARVESDSESDAKPAARPSLGTRSQPEQRECPAVRRSARNAAPLGHMESENDCDEDGDDLEEETSTRSSRRVESEASDDSDEEAEEEEVSESETGSAYTSPSLRNRTRPPHKKRAAAPTSRSNTRRSAPAKSARSTRNTRARAKANHSEESEFDEADMEDEESEPDEVEQVPPSRARTATRGLRSSRKRCHGSDSSEYEDTPPPRPKRGRTDRSLRHASTSTSPSKWRDIEVTHITKVVRYILKSLRAADADNLFRAPVAEAYPDIISKYLKVIKTPMDFRTIEQERLPKYEHICEFQQDLWTTFSNCIAYNGPDTVYGTSASTLMGLMDELFASACIEFGA